MSSLSKIIQSAVLIISVPLFIYSIYRVCDYQEIAQNEKDYAQNITQLAPEIEKSDHKPLQDEDPQDEIQQDIIDEVAVRKIQPWATNMLSRNSDAIGWIRIPGFTDDNGNEYINFPVLQGTDNDFYLNHNLDKEYYYSGSIYVDYTDKITKDKQPNNIVIYGHHMRTLGTSFTHLAEYKDGVEMLKKHPIIEFNTIYDAKPMEYIIVSCYVAAAYDWQDNNLFDYWRYHYFNSKKPFKEWYDRTMAHSWYSCNIKCTEEDDYITLSTCSNEVKDMRWVIVAKKLTKKDDKEKIIQSYAEKPDSEIYFPACWQYVWGNQKKYLGWAY